MNCKKCGFLLAENDLFCKNCGASVNEPIAQNMNVGVMEDNVVSQPVNNNVITETQSQAQPSAIPGVVSQSQFQQPTNQQPMNQPVINQSTMNQQPTWSNSYNNQPNYNQVPQNNNNGNGKFIILGVAIVALILIVFIVITIFSPGENKYGDMSNNEGNNNTSQVANNSTYKVKFKNFTFKIPTDLIYEVQTDSMLIGDDNDTWAVAIEVLDGTYSQWLSHKNQLQGAFAQQGYIAQPAQEKTIAGKSYITLELSESGTNILFGLTKANSIYTFGITAYNVNNQYDYDLLNKISSILTTAEYNSETNNISTFNKVDFNAVKGLLQ